jgi:hypothetical protein
VSGYARKVERRSRGLPELVYRDALAAGCSELGAQYVAYVASFGARGCWKSDRKVAGDKRGELAGELPPGRRGPHHRKSLPRVRRDPRVQALLRSRRIAPLAQLPGAKKLRSLHGAVHVVFLPMLRAEQRRRQRAEHARPPGLAEHETRQIGNAEEALAALGWTPRGPPP